MCFTSAVPSFLLTAALVTDTTSWLHPDYRHTFGTAQCSRVDTWPVTCLYLFLTKIRVYEIIEIIRNESWIVSNCIIYCFVNCNAFKPFAWLFSKEQPSHWQNTLAPTAKQTFLTPLALSGETSRIALPTSVSSVRPCWSMLPQCGTTVGDGIRDRHSATVQRNQPRPGVKCGCADVVTGNLRIQNCGSKTADTTLIEGFA